MQNEYSDVETVSAKSDTFLVNLAIGCVIFSFEDGILRILLIRQKNYDKWMLPAGLIREGEGIEEAAKRVVRIKANVEDSYVHQFHLFGARDRYDFETHKEIFYSLGFDSQHDVNLKHAVCMGFYAFVRANKDKPLGNSKTQECRWFEIKDIPDLYFDHNLMIKRAFISIRQKLGYVPLAFSLLPEKFTMPELRTLYEAFVGRPLDRRNFQRKMISLDFLVRLNEKRKKGAHKSPYLYCFDVEKYQKILSKEEQLVIWSF